MHDIFISYSREDRSKYIDPLIKALEARGIKVWDDNSQIRWGDSIPERIEEGLRASKFVLLCLSGNSLGRRWPNKEKSSILSSQISSGVERLLPLILDSKEEVLKQNLLLQDLLFKEYNGDGDWDAIAIEISNRLLGNTEESSIAITIESVYTEKVIHFDLPPNRTVGWLAEKARQGFGLKNEADLGLDSTVRFRYALVDKRMKSGWVETMSMSEKHHFHALVFDENEVIAAYASDVRLKRLSIQNGAVFHLYPLQIESLDMPPFASSPNE